MRAIERAWQTRGLVSCLLLPVSWVYGAILALRRAAYASGLKKTGIVPLPVVVVGNLSVGGTGKTPLCACLVERFERAGWRPAIVSRGYGGPRREQPYLLTDDDTAQSAGDEPLMLFQQTRVPVCVCIDRTAAVDRISTDTAANIVFADDGLQHLALPRVAEVLVVDGARGFGNRWLLPAGPLRDVLARAANTDLVAIQVPSAESSYSEDSSFLTPAPIVLHASLKHPAVTSTLQGAANGQFVLEPTHLIHLATGSRRELSEFTGERVHALAGIGHPQRFFDSLVALGMLVEPHPMNDHQEYVEANLNFHDQKPVMVTSKDAVKLMRFEHQLDKVFEVCVRVRCTQALDDALLKLERKLRSEFIVLPGSSE